MTTRRCLTLLCLAAAAFLCAGCALRPDHVTVFAERDVAETDAARRSRTETSKIGTQAT